LNISQCVVASDITFQGSEEWNEACSEWEEVKEDTLVEDRRGDINDVEKPVTPHLWPFLVSPSSLLL
jgi:hypothetical protein